MPHQLVFSKLAAYDPGMLGITLSVRLGLTGHDVPVDAKVDTGASERIFERDLGEQLGLDIDAGEPLRIETVMGVFTAYRHEVTMSVLGYSFDVRVCFAKEPWFSRNVLGRHGFLDRVRVAIVDYDGKLYLSRYDE